MRLQFAGLIPLCCISVLALGGCGSAVDSDGFPVKPETAAQGREVVWVEDAPSLVQESDLVIRATVTKTDIGQTYGSAGDAFTTRFVDLRVDEVLWAKSEERPSVGSTIQLEEEGYDADKTGYVMNGVPWSSVDDQGYYFLVADPDGGDYRQVNSQGRVIYAGQRKGPTGEDPQERGPWKGRANELVTQSAIQAIVSQAIARAERTGGAR